jgi:hypothetical protein
VHGRPSGPRTHPRQASEDAQPHRHSEAWTCSLTCERTRPRHPVAVRPHDHSPLRGHALPSQSPRAARRGRAAAPTQRGVDLQPHM